jgi:hypothetical protein
VSEQPKTDILPAVISPPKREIVSVFDAAPMFDTHQYDHMVRVATNMARASFLPEALQVFRDENGMIVSAKDGQFDFQGTVGNCIAVINTSRAFRMDPMAVAECMSMVKGKRCYEGKMVAAAIETNLGVELKYTWSGDPNTDQFAIRIEHPDDPDKYVEGTVAAWKTAQWGDKRVEYRKRLKYRGDREWCRMWKPALMMGVLTDDEMDFLAEDARARRARTISSGVAERLTARGPEGFDHDHVRQELVDHNKKGGDVAASDGTTDSAGSEVPSEDTESNNQNADASAGASDQAGAVPAAESDEGAAPPMSTPAVSSSPDQSSKSGDGAEADNDRASAPKSKGAGAKPKDKADAPAPQEETGNAFAQYSNTLARATQSKSLKSLSDDFRNRNAWTTDEGARANLKGIYDLHQKRIRDGLAPGAIAVELREFGVK